MSGEVVHFEVPADNTERARKFYSSTFGWKLQHMPEMDYTMVQTGESSEEGMPKEPGYIGGGLAKRGGTVANVVITVSVDDIDKHLKTIEKNGGKTIQKKQPIGDGSMGFTAYFKDTEGNTIGLWQMGKQP
jgi:predicted enzyme related to lactoylglutathione lyase